MRPSFTRLKLDEMKGPSDEERAEFRKKVNEMIAARIDMFTTNAPKYAESLATFRAALEKSGFSKEESMQIVLKVAERPRMRPFFGGHRRHWHKHDETAAGQS